MIDRRNIGRIEQDQRVPAPVDLDGVLHRGAPRHGVKNADRGLLAEPGVDRIAYAVEVAAQLRVIVIGRLDWNILPMIAEIEYQHIVVQREELPERQVGVGRKAVAVGDREAHAIAIAVPPDANARAILQDDIKRLARHRNDEIHSLALRYSDRGATRYAWIAVCLPARSLILSRSAVVARRRRVTVLWLHPGCKSS